MSKELYISTSPHETKVAVLEDDQLVEVYYEREIDTGLAGGIYKGRVSRVLPGMQSAFVDIGLERDAFLYVSDFYEDQEEYEKVFTEAEARATRYEESARAGKAEVAAPVVEPEHAPAERVSAPAGQAEARGAPPVPEAPAVPEVAPAPPVARPAEERPPFRRPDPRGRRRHRRERGFGEPRFAPRPEHREGQFEILPGESLAKYGRATPAQGTAPPDSAVEARAEGSETPEAEALPASPEPPAAEITAAPAIPERPATADEASVESPFVEPELPTPQPSRGMTFTSETVEPAPPLIESPAAEEGPTIPSTVFESSPALSPLPAEPAGLEPPAVEPERQSAEPPVAEGDAGPAVEATTPEVWTAPTKTPAVEADESEQEASASDPTEHARGPLEAGGSPTEAESAVADQGLEPHTEGGTETPAELPVASTETAGEPAEAKYTLREPHRGPRFAPRRRRGRRGMDRRPHPERHEAPRPGNHQPAQIADLLKEGQEILVQIAKEPLGTKGARITSHIALPGRYLVYMPTITHIGVSRKITSEEERLRLRNIILENRGPLTGGFIVRTAGQGRSETELKADLRFLSTLWNEIRAKAERSKAPALLHRDLDLVQRILRDILSPDFKTVRVDNEVEYERVVEFVNRCQPSLVGHVKLYTRATPMFEEFSIQGEIDKALKPKVWLKSGGYIVINQTEALVAIDVNTGKYVGKTNRLEDTIVKTNIDAVNEIVRQIRLRDLGGILVIDFIDMDERKNRNKVVQALEEALRRDRAPTKILSFNEFGLVALTRKRVKQSLERTLCHPCPYCTGAGWVKSASTVCHEILAEARKMAELIEGDTLTLRVNPEVAQALKSRHSALLSELESLIHKDVIVKSDSNVHQERFEIY